MSILKARVAHAQDYTKRKFVFRLSCTDGSEYLFLANTEAEMNDWVNKINFHAQLPPSLQLLSYDDSQKVCGLSSPIPSIGPIYFLNFSSFYSHRLVILMITLITLWIASASRMESKKP